MGDFDRLADHVGRLGAGEIISDAAARVVANWWHAGKASALTALATSGAILPGAGDEIGRAINDVHHAAPGTFDVPMELAFLANLAAYVRRHGERGPVAGWSAIWI